MNLTKTLAGVAGALILLTHFAVGLKRKSPACVRQKRDGIMYYKTRGGMERCRKKDCGILPRDGEHQNCYCCRLKDQAPAHVATSSLSTTNIALIVIAAVVAIVGVVAVVLLKKRASTRAPGIESDQLIAEGEPDSPPIQQNGTEGGDSITVAIPEPVVKSGNVRVMQGRGPSQSEAGLNDQVDDQDCNVDDDEEDAFQCEPIKPEEDRNSCSDAPYVFGSSTFHRDSKLVTDFEGETPL